MAGVVRHDDEVVDSGDCGDLRVELADGSALSPQPRADLGIFDGGVRVKWQTDMLIQQGPLPRCGLRRAIAASCAGQQLRPGYRADGKFSWRSSIDLPLNPRPSPGQIEDADIRIQEVSHIALSASR